MILRVTPDGDELLTETTDAAWRSRSHRSATFAQVVRRAACAGRGGPDGRRRQTLAVLGRSGTGKSVLLKLIVGLQKPDAGSIRIHGQELPSSSLEAINEIRKSMGFLFQHAALYDSLTVAENVAFPLRVIPR